MDRNLRVYTKKRLNSANFFSNLLQRFSVTNWIIIVNVIFFLIISIISLLFGEKIFEYIALQPNAFFSGVFWTLITSMFMHGSITHLLVNMISLFFIGNFVEKLIGRKRIFLFYMISGIIGGLFFVFLSHYFGLTNLGSKLFGNPDIYAVGASGAIFALGGLLAVLIPNLKVYVLFFIPMKMWQGIVFLLAGFWLLSFFGDLSIGNTAHFGGLIAGLAYGYYLKKKYRQKTELISRIFSR
jgi:uncharacterized protein